MHEPYCNEEKGLYSFREPRISDGSIIHRLIERSKPLDLNSLYSYLLLAEHFKDTCIVAERVGNIVGFISAYVHPSRKDTLFVWQVAVDEQERGNGVAGRMLERLFARAGLKSVSYLETTVNPSNQRSRHLFESFAKRFQAPCTTSVLFPKELFGKDTHEAEILFRIGPFQAL
ncbi:MAG: diaminobutyrate acetyltransferase [Deltaproteobacteria bacterium]|nr:diaminobutyrate acetyltransferase [Deltaproteobacteria bacterium]